MNNAVMRGVMTRIGFSEDAAQALFNEQGMHELQEIRLLTDNEVKNLCKVIRRPAGGTILNPEGGNPNPAPGVQVNLRAEEGTFEALGILFAPHGARSPHGYCAGHHARHD